MDDLACKKCLWFAEPVDRDGKIMPICTRNWKVLYKEDVRCCYFVLWRNLTKDEKRGQDEKGEEHA
jgi:uncharacterized radical SAM superfamily Fe-S cluster-containing enzyme